MVSSKMRWIPTSGEEQASAEERMLAPCSNIPVRQHFVHIRNGKYKINTISVQGKLEQGSSDAELVLVHGFGAGVGFWNRNLEYLAGKYPAVHAIDLLGFGRSSRPSWCSILRESFHRKGQPIWKHRVNSMVSLSASASKAIRDTVAENVEDWWVDSIEDWRRAMGIKKMVLVGHSLGGYLVGCYALKYPENLHTVVLADPVGIPVEGDYAARRRKMPLRFRMIARALWAVGGPLSLVRMLGPWGRKVVRLRKDFAGRHPEVEPNVVLEYIYHSNAQKSSGEQAFRALFDDFAWANRPLFHRLKDLEPSVRCCFLYGERSFMDSKMGESIHQSLGSRSSFHVIPNAGHHIQSDQPKLFNKIVGRLTKTISSDVP